jgi:hypothetical protein
MAIVSGDACVDGVGRDGIVCAAAAALRGSEKSSARVIAMHRINPYTRLGNEVPEQLARNEPLPADPPETTIEYLQFVAARRSGLPALSDKVTRYSRPFHRRTMPFA